MDLTIISATKETEDGFAVRPLGRYLKRDPRLFDNALIFYKNEEGLSKVYNQALTQLDKTPGRCALMVHDDVAIKDCCIAEKLSEAFTAFDIVGLAGCVEIQTMRPSAWHLMGERRSGAVAHIQHIDGAQKTSMTSYGLMPESVQLIDGLFIALSPAALLSGVRFDERFLFHHYDLDFCLSASRNGLRIGTWPIWVTHHSTGESINKPEWRDSKQVFLQKWAGSSQADDGSS